MWRRAQGAAGQAGTGEELHYGTQAGKFAATRASHNIIKHRQKTKKRERGRKKSSGDRGRAAGADIDQI
jgi:hypothetical protein